MSRVNVGIHPKYLSDQHLIAEHVEITMITGGLRKNKYQIKSFIPENFTLGKGHINFFKNKIKYLQKRLESVKNEMKQRGFKFSCFINIYEFPTHLVNDWNPSIIDSMIVRKRIEDKINLKTNFYRYNKKEIVDISDFIKTMKESKLNIV